MKSCEFNTSTRSEIFEPSAMTPAQDFEKIVRQKKIPSQNASAEARMLVGTLVLCSQNRDFLMANELGELKAVRRADSCLFDLQAGDLVQAVSAQGLIWVLAILQSTQVREEWVMNFGDRAMRMSANSIELETSGQMSLRAQVLKQFSVDRHSRIKNTDSIHAGNSLQHTERHMGLHAKSAMITASSLLKVDAAQIHMG
jgi:hypothetical protein